MAYRVEIEFLEVHDYDIGHHLIDADGVEVQLVGIDGQFVVVQYEGAEQTSLRNPREMHWV